MKFTWVLEYQIYLFVYGFNKITVDTWGETFFICSYIKTIMIIYTCILEKYCDFYPSPSSVSPRWVAYENPEFTGEQYILAKGLYPSIEAWGGKNCKISSVQPIIMVRNSFYPCLASFSEVFRATLFLSNSVYLHSLITVNFCMLFYYCLK